jgi:hypothetical protein
LNEDCSRRIFDSSDRRQRPLSGFPSKEKPLRSQLQAYVKSENVLGNGSLIRRRPIAERKGEDVFTVLPLIENCNPGEDNEDLLNAGCRRWLGYIMSALAKRAIRTSRTVGVDVSKLCRGAKEEEDCEERNEQNAGRCVRRSHFASPQHRYLSIYLKNSERPKFEFSTSSSKPARNQVLILDNQERSSMSFDLK